MYRFPKSHSITPYPYWFIFPKDHCNTNIAYIEQIIILQESVKSFKTPISTLKNDTYTTYQYALLMREND